MLGCYNLPIFKNISVLSYELRLVFALNGPGFGRQRADTRAGKIQPDLVSASLGLTSVILEALAGLDLLSASVLCFEFLPVPTSDLSMSICLSVPGFNLKSYTNCEMTFLLHSGIF